MALLSGLLNAVDLPSTAQNRFRPITEWLATRLDLPHEAVMGTWVSEPKMVAPRLSTPGIVRTQPPVVLAVLNSAHQLNAYLGGLRRKMTKDAHLRTVMAVEGSPSGGPWALRGVLTRPGEPAADAIRAQFGPVTTETVRLAADRPAAFDRSTGRPPVIVDDRIRRMLRTGLSTSRAVVLVGPPGTGKTTMVEQVLGEIRANPAGYGLRLAVQPTDPVTPDESWTALDVVGGPTLDAGRIVFRPGHVLRAISENRWVFLDEANRADLDKILGGLLTWLSGKEVVVGRVSEAVDAPLVTVGWSDGPGCEVEHSELLSDPDATTGGGGRVRFLAGQEWRMVATYNAVDAQRVFRFGAALGRRFATVPVPPPGVEAVAEILADICARLLLEPATAERVIGLYEAHQGAEETVLGPASFLEVPGYVARTIAAGEVDESDPAAVEAAVAEGYLLHVGQVLARLEEDELDRLGDRLGVAGAVGRESWAWARSLLPTLRG